MIRLAALFLLTFQAFGQTTVPFPDSPYERAINGVLEGIYGVDNSRVNSSLAEMDRLRQGYPPALVYRELLASWRAADDPGNDTLLSAFDTASSNAIAAAEAWTAREPNSAEAWRYLASAYGQKAQFAVSVRPNWAIAANYGLKGHQAIAKSKELDDKNPDIWVGLGAYDYFRANLPAALKVFSWMFVGLGNRDRGLQEIQFTMDNGWHSRTEAAIVLAGAYYSEGRYTDFSNLMRQKVTGPYPQLASQAGWEIGGCLCTGKFNQARNVIQTTRATQAWTNFQLGRVAFAEGKVKDAEAFFTKTLAAPDRTISLTTWAYSGLERSRKAQGKAVEPWRQATQVSKSALALANRYFSDTTDCPKAKQ